MRRAARTAAAGSPTDRKPSPRKRPVAVRALTGALLFQGVSGTVGGYGLVSDPSGRSLGFPPGWLQGSPFPDYLVPGLVLLTALGVLPLLVAYGVWTGRSWSRRPAIAVGLALLVWLAVEVVVVGYQPDPPLQLVYGLVGGAILVLGVAPSVRKHLTHGG